MKKLILPIFFSVFLFSATAFAQVTPIRSDFQIWNDTLIAIPLKKSHTKTGVEFDRTTLSIVGTLRFGRNAARPVDERIAVGLSYHLNKYVSFVPDVLYRGYQPYKGRKEYESRFRFAVVLENKWKYFSLNDRNQIEYRLRNSRQDSVRYKNRLRLNVPVVKNKRNIFTPFVSDEPYYDFQAHDLTRNELFAGIGKRFTKDFEADFFYLFENEKGFPKKINGIGVNLRFRIDRETNK